MRTGKFIIGILLLCCFIRMVIGEPCTVPSGSMEPTLLCGDRLWINKLAYGGRFPSRWADIPLLNVFTYALCVLLMKRIIGSIVVCRVTANLNRGILRCSTARQIRNCCWSSELPGW